jgi:L-alanine-DL-glutamate epimerase-like enolase superfamily enzyme
MVRTIHEIMTLVENDALDVIQADVVLAAGMHHSIKIAELAKSRGHIFTPHTWSNGYGLAANLQVTAGIGGAPFIEFPFDPPTWTAERRDFLMAEPMLVGSDGLLHVPAAPGLGIEPNWSLFKKSVA